MKRIALIALPLLLGTRGPQPAARSHTVRMQGGRFSPAELTIAKGDTVKFVLGSGGPHNVAFNETTGDAAVRLRKLMPNQMADLASPLLVNPTDTYTIVFGEMPVGSYPYWCLPHLAMGQMGSITVK